MAEQSLKEKTAKGLFWGGLSNGVQQLLNLFFGIFLSRILSAEDYGMVGMLSIFSLIAGSLQESGFTAALANKREISHKDYNAVFWFSTGLSACLYLMLFFCAPLIAEFYHTPELTALARYTFLGFFVAGLGIAHSAYLFRNLMVKQKAMAVTIGQIASGTIGVTMACLGFAYWGIATQSIVYVGTINLCYLYFSPWRPTFTFDFKPLKGMFSFSSKLLVTNLFHHINNNLFAVILGRFYSGQEVGYFTQANKWNYMGHSLISGTVNSVAQPVLSTLTDERERQQRAFRKMLRFTALLSFPAMLGLSLIAPELIVLTITDKWLPSASILQLLCIGGAFIPITHLYSNLVISKGKPNIYMWNTIGIGMIQLAVMLLLYPYGVHTLIKVYVSVHICHLFVWHYFVWREIRLSLLAALKDIVPYAGAAILTTGLVYFLTAPVADMYLRICIKIFLSVVIYATLMGLSGSITFKEAIRFFLDKIKKRDTDKGSVTLIPVGGLCNRMKAIDAAIALTAHTGAALRIIWFKDKGLNCRFDELFQPFSTTGRTAIEVKEASAWDLLLYDRPRRKNFNIPALFQRLLFDRCVYEQEVTQLFYRHFDFRQWSKGHTVYIAGCVYFYPRHDRPLFESFVPIPALQARIASACTRFNAHTVGIHIRRTDNRKSIELSPTSLFVQRIRKRIEENEDSNFYLATDSEEEKQSLCGLFGERIITSSQKAERNSVPGMQHALVELYILSRAGSILGSAQSSYSETAAQIGGIACELINKQP